MPRSCISSRRRRTTSRLKPIRNFTSSGERVQFSVEKAYAEIAKSVNIPGFRRGKVPPMVIDQRFGRGVVIQEAFNDSWPTFYGVAVQENHLNPVAQPELEVTKLEDGDLIEFTPGTAAELPWLFDADASQLDGTVYDGRARFTDGNSYATYRLEVPSDLTGGSLTLDIGNQYLVQVSPDNQNWRTILEETNNVRDLANRAERSFDLNDLRGDGRTIYVRIADSQPADGWGAWLARMTLRLQRAG